jgi:hypothetical protein
MPHLMNCEHSDEGWCLACVDELEEARRSLEVQMEIMVKIIKNMVPFVPEGFSFAIDLGDDEAVTLADPPAP